MDLLWLFLMLAASFLIGAFGFPQIVGSLQTVKQRGLGITIFTITLWGAILIVVGVTAYTKFPNLRLAYYIGTGASLLSTLKAGKIE